MAIAGQATGDSDQVAGRTARAGRAGRTLGQLILAGVWVRLGFQAKEIEAWTVLPALRLAWLLSGPAWPVPSRPCG